MKKNMIIGLFAILLTFTLGGQSASFSLAVPSAFADTSVLNAQINHGDTVGSCLVCPPEVGKPEAPGTTKIAKTSGIAGITKTTICHYTSGLGNPAETITVGNPAVLNAHMNHGDTLGACLICPFGVDSCVRADGKPRAPGATRIARTSGMSGTPGTPGMPGMPGTPGTPEAFGTPGATGIALPSSMRQLRGS